MSHFSDEMSKCLKNKYLQWVDSSRVDAEDCSRIIK